MTTLNDEIVAIARSATAPTDKDARSLATRGVRKLGAAHLRELAIREVEDWIERIRRSAAREAEQSAAYHQRIESEQAKAKLDADTRVSNYEAWLADPTILDWSKDCTDAGIQTAMPNKVERQRFVKWLGDRYDEWYQRGCELTGTSPHFASDFYRGGSRLWFALERERRVEALIEEVAEEVRLETTAELLNTIFALGDGSKTTWGRATVAQHQQRIQMLAKNAAGVIETAALHRAAISMIESAGVVCLAEVPDADIPGMAAA